MQTWVVVREQMGWFSKTISHEFESNMLLLLIDWVTSQYWLNAILGSKNNKAVMDLSFHPVYRSGTNSHNLLDEFCVSIGTCQKVGLPCSKYYAMYLLWGLIMIWVLKVLHMQHYLSSLYNNLQSLGSYPPILQTEKKWHLVKFFRLFEVERNTYFLRLHLLLLTKLLGILQGTISVGLEREILNMG